jgi:antirestriction protein ArdC
MNEQTYEKLTSGIIAALEEAIATGGVAPWQKPWLGIQASNPVTKTVYSGVNRLVLEWSGRADPRWLTFKQAQALKGQVKKGAKGVPVCY